jgi:hypothetical protein
LIVLIRMNNCGVSSDWEGEFGTFASEEEENASRPLLRLRNTPSTRSFSGTPRNPYSRGDADHDKDNCEEEEGQAINEGLEQYEQD